MQEAIQVGLLTIGTEVSQGQIINTNSSWLANQLVDLRLDPRWHLTVIDSRDDILKALAFLKQQVKIIIVTGGLGPTSDDITRNVISEWSEDQLIHSDAAWEHIKERFAQLGVEPPPSNRQQCLFPSRAKILDNAKGTAHAFRFEYKGTLCFSLPGPPEEIKVIWQQHIIPELSHLSQNTDPLQLFRWQCLGLSESAIGEIVEELVKDSDLIAGYRPHLPYIEIKIWVRESQLTRYRDLISRIDLALQKWTLARDDEDCIDPLLAALKNFAQVQIDDFASRGAIAHRFEKKWHDCKQTNIELRTYYHENDSWEKALRLKGDCLQLKIGPLHENGGWDLSYHTRDAHIQKTLHLPYKRNPKRMDRERLFVTEMSLAFFSRLARNSERLA